MPDAWPESNFTFWKKDSGNSLAKSTGVTKKSRKNALPSNKVLYMYIGKLPKINGVGCASHLIIFCPVDISGFPMWMVFPFFLTIIWHKYLTLSCIYICICISITCSCTVWVIYAVLDFQKNLRASWPLSFHFLSPEQVFWSPKIILLDLVLWRITDYR